VRVIVRELLTALVLGLGTGAAVWALVAVVTGDGVASTIAGLSACGTICLGTVFGVLTPLALDRLGVDPAVATTPFVTTVNDVVGSTIIIVVALMVL
jgi:magnesium transporter